MANLSTINKQEIEKFSQLAKEWWNPAGKFKPLHKFNPIRIEFIREKIISHFKLNELSSEPLKKINILDIGCGGGLLTEPMARMGGVVTGIDASKKNIEIAKIHANEMGLNIKYINCPPEKLDSKKKYDVILNLEVVEHIKNLDLFIKTCSKIIKKNGIMFVATINRTLESYVKAIVGAEYILRWLPIGTHDWNNFLTPKELERLTTKNNFLLNEIVGLNYSIFSDKWETSANTSVNYITTFIKN